MCLVARPIGQKAKLTNPEPIQAPTLAMAPDLAVRDLAMPPQTVVSSQILAALAALTPRTLGLDPMMVDLTWAPVRTAAAPTRRAGVTIPALTPGPVRTTAAPTDDGGTDAAGGSDDSGADTGAGPDDGGTDAAVGPDDGGSDAGVAVDDTGADDGGSDAGGAC